LSPVYENFFGAFENLWKVTLSFIVSLSIHTELLSSQWVDFCEVLYGDFH
jgi:hypothetical protein